MRNVCVICWGHWVRVVQFITALRSWFLSFWLNAPSLALLPAGDVVSSDVTLFISSPLSVIDRLDDRPVAI